MGVNLLVYILWEMDIWLWHVTWGYWLFTWVWALWCSQVGLVGLGLAKARGFL